MAKNLGDLREWYANKAATNKTPRPNKKQIFDKMEFVRDINQECFNKDGKELLWKEGVGAKIAQRLVKLDFNNLEK